MLSVAIDQSAAGETTTVSGDPWAAGTGGGPCSPHPVGSNVAISPAAIAAAFKVFLCFAFIGRAFQLRAHSHILQLITTNGCYRLYTARRKGLFYLSQIA